jgi:hypothetical protein
VTLTAYHGSSADLSAAIERHGLLPRDGAGPFLTRDPQRARGYGVRCSCFALAEADPDCDLAHLPAALLVVVSAPPTALLPDPANAADFWLIDPGAAKLKLEVFDARPWIASPAEARKYADLMLRARQLEDQWGSARRRRAEGKPPLADQDAPASRRPSGPANGPPTIARVNTGTPLG